MAIFAKTLGEIASTLKLTEKAQKYQELYSTYLKRLDGALSA